jgi:hypothetical protein
VPFIHGRKKVHILKVRIIISGKDTSRLLNDFFGVPDLGGFDCWEETYELEKIIDSMDLDELYAMQFSYDVSLAINYQRCDDCSMESGPNCLNPLECPECGADMEIVRCLVSPAETAKIYKKPFPMSMWRCSKEGCWSRVDYDLSQHRSIPYRTLVISREN